MSQEVEITVDKDLISAEIDGFKQIILDKLAGSPDRIILDLQKVEVVDSSGIGMLIAARNSAVKAGCEIILKSVNPDIMKMFRIMRLTDHFIFVN